MTDDERYEQETNEHIRSVRYWIGRAQENLDARSHGHDQSKLKEPERSGFQAMTADARLKDLTYGSPEYRAVLKQHAPTINHHYANNDHHPEYWSKIDPIRRMSFLSLLEMLCDWKASTARMKDGNLERSIEVNQERFGYSDELKWILLNTARELGMV